MRLNNDTFDLIVIGAGIAGLTTATTAAESGLRVCLVEKQPHIGGSSAMSGGWFAFSGTPEQQAEGIEDNRELFRQDLLNVGGHLNDERLVDAYLGHQEATYTWLKEHGTQFREVEISSGMSARRGHLSDIRDLLQRLHTAFTRAGGTTLFDTPARRLLTEDDRVRGVEILHGGRSRVLVARRGVVIASGGFSRATDLLSAFAPEQLAAIPYGGPGNTGDGLKMAWKLGAGLTDMSFVSATYGSHPETTDAFHELLTAYYLGALVVNLDGERFVDESKSYKTLGRAVLDQPEGLGFQIFDAAVRAQSQPGVPLVDMEMLEEIEHLHSAPTLEELARQIGVDPQRLRQTVEDYNAAVRGGRPDAQNRTSLCNGVGELVPIEQGPFYAYPAKALMTSTYCGLTVTPHGQVEDVFGETIAGLYAVGEVVGGFHGAAYMTGTSLGKGAVFGHLIAQNIAAEAETDILSVTP